MSLWSEQNYPFTGNSTQDTTITKACPAIILNATETGGVYQEIREINGDLWTLTNCTYNSSSNLVTQVNPSMGSSGLQLTTASNIARFYQVAGTASWALGSWPQTLMTLVNYALSGTYSLGLSGNINAVGYIAAGQNYTGTLATGDIGVARSAISGNISFGAYSATGGDLDYGVTQTGGFSMSSPLQILPAIAGSIVGAVPAVYQYISTLTTGISAGQTTHINFGSFVATGASTSVTFTTGQGYPNSYVLLPLNITTGALAPVTAKTTTGFTLTTVNTDTYNWLTLGY